MISWKSSSFSTHPIRRLLPYLWSEDRSIRQHLVFSLILLLVAKIPAVIVPIFYKVILDHLQIDAATAHISVWISVLIIGYGLTRVLASGLTELRDALFTHTEQYAIRKIALQVFAHLHVLSLRFHLDRKTGSLSRAIERGTKSIETFFRFFVFNIFPTFLEIFIICSILWMLYPGLFALLTFLILALYILFTLLVSEWRTTLMRQMNQIDGEAGGKALDSLLNYTTVKYFGNEAEEITRYDAFLSSYAQAAVKNRYGLSLLNFGQALIISVGLTIIMFLAATSVTQGQMTIGDFALINMYLLQVYIPLNILGFAYREIRQALLNMDEMFCLLDLSQEVKDSPQAVPLVLDKGRIDFDHVCFSYNPDRPILKDLSFTLEAQKTLAIVGLSGAGKSTILSLLFRFFDPQEGHIRIDGQDIQSMTQASLRQAIAVVPQDTILFNDTLFYNIAYGNLTASAEEVEEAAKRAHIHTFIMKLPQKYETRVGERGLKLSGGEKQRVAIARALLKNPAIFIFDEATSSLDTQTEKAIQQDLKRISKGSTTLIVAHRLSTIVDADQIIVLEEGRLVEKGTHSTLLAQKGAYAMLWAKQQREEKVII